MTVTIQPAAWSLTPAAATSVPRSKGWSNATQKTAVNGIALEYGFFEPSFKAEDSACFNPFAPETTVVPQKAPLVVYLHGAGEGKGATQGEGATRAYIGNRVTAISQAQIQRYFGGFAWVLVPQSPTFWMDNGTEQLGHSNQSIYSPVIKALIDEFVAEHADRIDNDRIVVAGLSNGGFMTLRLCADYPEFFAAGLPCCGAVVQRHGRGRCCPCQDTAVVYALQGR